MIPDTWWFWLIISVMGYVMAGTVVLAATTWVLPMTGDSASWDKDEAAMAFWLWPLLASVGIFYILGKVYPIVIVRMFAPARIEVEGRKKPE